MMLKFKIMWIIIIVILVIIVGCSYNAVIEVDNNDPDGWTMSVTVDGETKTVYTSYNKTWDIEWTGLFQRTYTVSMSATYSYHGGYISNIQTVEDGEHWIWTITIIPGFYY